MLAIVRDAIRGWALMSLALLGALLGYGVSQLERTGRFEQWQSLGQPPEAVVSLDARWEGVWAYTTSGHWYSFPRSETCAEPATCWQAAKPPPAEVEPAALRPLEDCVPMPLLWGAQTSVARCANYGMADALTVYALRPDGSVWRWDYFRDFEYGGLISLFVWGGLGFCGGLVAIVFIGKNWSVANSVARPDDESRLTPR